MPSEEVICSGLAERIGHDDAIFNLKYNGEKKVKVLPLKDHSAAVKMLLDSLMEEKIISSFSNIKPIAHRLEISKKLDKTTTDCLETNLILSIRLFSFISNTSV